MQPVIFPLYRPAEDSLKRPNPQHFTRRETEILGLISLGYTDKAVALSLGISGKTVETHLRRVFLRLGIHSRAAAIAVWLSSYREPETGSDVISLENHG